MFILTIGVSITIRVMLDDSERGKQLWIAPLPMLSNIVSALNFVRFSLKVGAMVIETKYFVYLPDAVIKHERHERYEKHEYFNIFRGRFSGNGPGWIGRC